MEVCDTIEEAVIKTIPKKTECKKAKWLPEEALQIAEKSLLQSFSHVRLLYPYMTTGKIHSFH